MERCFVCGDNKQDHYNIDVNERRLCDLCRESFFMCEICGKWEPRANLVYTICPDCIENGDYGRKMNALINCAAHTLSKVDAMWINSELDDYPFILPPFEDLIHLILEIKFKEK